LAKLNTFFNAETGELIPTFTHPAPQDASLVFAGEVEMRFSKGNSVADSARVIWDLVKEICPDNPASIFENAIVPDGDDYLFLGKVYRHEEVLRD